MAVTEDETAAEFALRAEIRRELEGRLTVRREGRRVQVMGGGSDDLEEGRAFLRALADGGWAVPSWPVEHGGRGASPDEAVVIAEELARFELPDLYPFMVGIDLVGPALMEYGTDDQKARWLPKIKTGEEIWCQLFSEPDAGSDLANLACRAERDGDTWRMTGQKVWSSRAHYSRWGMLLARTDPSVPKHKGISVFAVDMEAPGVVVRPLRQMNGDAHFNEVFLDDTPVADADRIGGLGDGWRVTVTTLAHERGSIGGAGSVSREAVLDLARRHGAGEDRLLRQRVADVLGRLQVAHQAALRDRAEARLGHPPGPKGSVAKLRMGANMRAVADLAVGLEGQAALADDNEWRTLFLSGPSFSIRGGTDEVQRNILGERVLGLPPEPRVDRDVPFAQRPR